jgi:hypothetical protein
MLKMRANGPELSGAGHYLKIQMPLPPASASANC